ncbi:MAG: hypothetical protein FGM61_07440 [Sediminibacterium sp.]|nr:hypothetical protein [Sediminibacterium sp.]
MAINKNHEFEEVNGKKCAIVEKNVSEERCAFLKKLLEYNGFEVEVLPTPPPKVQSTENESVVEKSPATFTIGVTHVGFNAINAVFGRLLRREDGQIVTLAYWQQKAVNTDDSIPYYQKN